MSQQQQRPIEIVGTLRSYVAGSWHVYLDTRRGNRGTLWLWRSGLDEMGSRIVLDELREILGER